MTYTKNKQITYDKVALFIKTKNIVMNPEYIGVSISTAYVCVGVGDVEYSNPLIQTFCDKQMTNFDQYFIMTFTIFMRMLGQSKMYVSNIGGGFSVLQ